MNISHYPYFDNNATTPIDNRVLEVLNEYQQKFFANPSSVAHPLGMLCNALWKEHCKKIADILSAKESEIIFTSGATESINTAIKGIYFQYHNQKNHIISCKTEHSAVLQTLKYLEQFHNASITLLDVNENGVLDLNDLEKNINEKTLMICLMAANNETGVLHPIEDISKIAKKKNVIFFSDTTQIFGKHENFTNIPADIFCGSAHKFYGPKGIGFIVIRNLGRKIFLHPLLHGGQQQEIRSGTLPLPLLAGLSKALEVILYHQDDIYKTKKLRDYFETKLSKKMNVKIHGKDVPRVFNTSNVQVTESYYEFFVKGMKKFCYSHGSACSDGTGKPSHVLSAMGLSKDEINRSFRFSFSLKNTKEEIDEFLKALPVTEQS